jgi:transposase, IS30 family
MGHQHLDYNQILTMLYLISLKHSLKSVANQMGVSRQTIYRLLKKYVVVKPAKIKYHRKSFRNCALLSQCRKDPFLTQCPNNCSKYKPYLCPKLRKFPYICNFCEGKNTCQKERHFFHPEVAYQQMKETKRMAHSKPHLPPKSLAYLNEWISPLIFDGKSIETIAAVYAHALPVSSRTIRNYIDRGYLDARRIDLRNAVVRTYKSDYDHKRPHSKNPLMKYQRTYPDFLEYHFKNPAIDVIQLDTIHGKITDRKKVLTIHHVKSHFQIGILLSALTFEEVHRAILELKKKLTRHQYRHFFQLVLTDNGPEFDGMPSLETDASTGGKITALFYTRPYRSGDKGACEKNHEFFRYIYKKGISFESLSQDTLDDVFSHINSYPRASLDYESPYDVFAKTYGIDFLRRIHIRKIDFEHIVLKRK